jgi:3-O-methylgallate 3,4-dioxygenase
MAEIVLGIATSHTPMLGLPAERWEEYANGDRANPELVFPPDGWSMPFDVAVAEYVPEDIRQRTGDLEVFRDQYDRIQRSLDQLAKTLDEVDPDITVIVSDDQDEWFYENNMPTFAVFWGDTVSVLPRPPRPGRDPELSKLINEVYGDVEVEVPVASDLGRHVISSMMDLGFDVSHVRYLEDLYGGRVARRYPTRTGEIDSVRVTEPHRQGLPHGYAFVVKRIFANRPRRILPVFQNTCYPPNNPTPLRCHRFGQALADAIAAWPTDARVAVVASGGLSHFVVDEELDRTLLGALERNDGDTLENLPRNRLYSATSESLNWVAVGGALGRTGLRFELLDYLPTYRTEAGTGGGWAFGTWQ